MIRAIILLGLSLLGIQINTIAQARLVLNGAKVNIANGAVLVVANGEPNAITRHDGHLISEGEDNKVAWHMGTTTGTYTVPWGVASTYLPLTFTKSAGTGSGLFTFATYQTGWHNSTDKPQGVGALVRSGTDYSHQAIDRFWFLNASDYTSIPELSNIGFTFSDNELAAPNMITETALKAQRWNGESQSWTEWRSESTASEATNTVNVSTIPSSGISGWWTLASIQTALPVRWLSFDAVVKEQDVLLNWGTAMEQQNDHFVVERSADGIIFNSIATVAGSGNSSINRTYTYTDKQVASGKWFYRLKQVDNNDAFQYSVIRTAIINATAFTIYPNPVVAKTFFIILKSKQPSPAILYITDANGNIVQKQEVPANMQQIKVQLQQALAAGVYGVQLQSNGSIQQQMILVY